ncbi:hypothetical protein Poli38472_010118 [Pythium oligandrum]|uniref:Arrestin C-terminal-like domain-containing protein n=1 Tax=Pythium oligandrum TaxID=41045 RepID=A0A8K1FF24_PYTOL|nr:hypothetical protein Poli38472_010118 [Pythium oligandrum]|eukprot:TMW58559.1 hypothetical protein Poli38472_010118 [Pythium oligandrum]
MGLFPRSAKVHVHVEQPTLLPGDTVTGVVTLEVLQAIDVQELLITLEGKEHLKWEETSGDSSSTYHRYHDLFSLATRCQVHATLIPGETSYPFSFQLPHGIPASFEYKNPGVRLLDWVEVRTEYKVTAEVTRNGRLTWSLTGSADLTVQPTAESLRVFLDSKPASALASQIVRAMGLFKRGQCHARVDLRSDVIPLGSEIKLTAFVDNDSAQKIKDVRVILYEDCVIDQEPTSGKRIERGTRRVIERKMPPEHVNGIVNGKPIALTLPLSEVDKMSPNMSSHFIQSLSYRLAVEVSLSLSSRVKVDVPIRVVHKDHVGISAPTTKLQCLG